MPSGIYIGSEKHIQQVRELGKKYGRRAIEIAHKLPRTQLQIETSRKNGRKVGKLPRKGKQLEGRIFGNDIVKHHQDLCHGAEKPNDVIFMTASKHIGLHAKLRSQYRKRDKGTFI